MGTVNTSALANQYQRKFSKDLLEHAIQELRLNEFAVQKDVKRNEGAISCRFHRRVKASASNVQNLSEGTPITNFTDLTYEAVDVTLAQIGEAMKITDIVSWTGLHDALKDGIALMGEDCALKADEITRNEVVINQTVAGQRRYAQGAADFATLEAATTANAVIVRTDWLDAVTRLKINRAPKFGGYYAAILPPQVARDVQEDGDWIEASHYGKPDQLFKGELGRMDGIRFVEATNPFIEKDTLNTFDADGGIFTTIITGRGGYGVTKLQGTQNPAKPQVIICNKADKSDPLNQFLTAGWKAFYAAKLLNTDWVITLRSKSGFAG